MIENELITFLSDGVVEIDKNGGFNVHVYLHEFGHILGCLRHFEDEESIMAEGSLVRHIDEQTKNFFLLLYSLPVGYRLL